MQSIVSDLAYGVQQLRRNISWGPMLPTFMGWPSAFDSCSESAVRTVSSGDRGHGPSCSLQLARTQHIEEKKMFGGSAFMVGGKMCVSVGRDRLMCRIEPAIHDAAS